MRGWKLMTICITSFSPSRKLKKKRLFPHLHQNKVQRIAHGHNLFFALVIGEVHTVMVFFFFQFLKKGQFDVHLSDYFAKSAVHQSVKRNRTHHHHHHHHHLFFKNKKRRGKQRLDDFRIYRLSFWFVFFLIFILFVVCSPLKKKKDSVNSHPLWLLWLDAGFVAGQ